MEYDKERIDRIKSDIDANLSGSSNAQTHKDLMEYMRDGDDIQDIEDTISGAIWAGIEDSDD